MGFFGVLFVLLIWWLMNALYKGGTVGMSVIVLLVVIPILVFVVFLGLLTIIF